MKTKKIGPTDRQTDRQLDCETKKIKSKIIIDRHIKT